MLIRRPILLVGSVPLRSAQAVFEQVGTRLGEGCASCPDGETGERLRWIGWSLERIARRPEIVVTGQLEIGGAVPQTVKFLDIAPNVDAAAIDFRPMGYACEAISSYADFVSMRNAGKIPAGMRFQVSMPSPFALTLLLGGSDAVLTAIERAYQGEIADIIAAIPGDDLTIQWDLAIETHNTELERYPTKGENLPPLPIGWSLERALVAAARAIDFIPSTVNVGIHLCYGDPGGHHLLEPADASVMIEIANGLTTRAQRKIDYIHFPVPIERDDKPYFAPFQALKLDPATQIYLGLVHQEDEVAGAKRRMTTASEFVTGYGIATECGLGRIEPAIIPRLLDLHREVSELDLVG